MPADDPTRRASLAASGPGSARPYVLWSDYSSLLRRHAALGIVLTLLGLAAGLVGAAVAPRAWTATASVLVTPTGVGVNNPGANRAPGGVDLDTEARMATSADVLRRVSADLAPAPDLSDRLHISVPPNSAVLEFAFEAPTPALAVQGANAFARAYLDDRRAQAEADLKAAVDRRRAHIAAIQVELRRESARLRALPEPQRPFVRARTEVLTREAAAASRSLDKLSATTVTPGRLLAAAKPPRRATAPAPLVWAASGLGVGLIAAVGATLLRDRTERRLRRREDVERVFGLPVLGALPAAFSVDKASLSRCGTGPFRYAAAELAAAVRPGGQLVLVAGASHAVPSGEAAVHLAGALARSGYDTLVVLADERDRDLGRQLGAGPVGLSDVVLDAIDPSTLTRDVAGLPDVRVIGPGAAPAEAGERLADPVEPALRRLRGLAHYVLIAGGAVVDTAQTGALANRVDATVLTVQLRRTNRNDVRESLRRLSGDPVVGAILVPAGRQHGRSPVLAGGAAPAGR